MTTSTPPCMVCAHYDRARLGNFCDAYPDEPGIPNEIIFGEVDHKTPYDGDHGIVFEPLPGETHPNDVE